METLTSSGWFSLADFPRFLKILIIKIIKEIIFFFSRTAFHSLIGLPSGSLLLAGGQRFEDNYVDIEKAIWILGNNTWRKIGEIQNVSVRIFTDKNFSFKADWRVSAIMIKNSIFIVSGSQLPHAIERLDFEGDQLIGQKVIGIAVENKIPVLFQASASFCV